MSNVVVSNVNKFKQICANYLNKIKKNQHAPDQWWSVNQAFDDLQNDFMNETYPSQDWYEISITDVGSEISDVYEETAIIRADFILEANSFLKNNE